MKKRTITQKEKTRRHVLTQKYIITQMNIYISNFKAYSVSISHRCNPKHGISTFHNISHATFHSHTQSYKHLLIQSDTQPYNHLSVHSDTQSYKLLQYIVTQHFRGTNLFCMLYLIIWHLTEHRTITVQSDTSSHRDVQYYIITQWDNITYGDTLLQSDTLLSRSWDHIFMTQTALLICSCIHPSINGLISKQVRAKVHFVLVST